VKTIPLIKPDLPTLEEIAGPLREALATGRITNFGPHVTELEKRAGAYLGAQVATVSSGTMGLLFTLQALGLKPGQKVLLPSFTFMATAQAVLFAGGVPVFAEIDDDMLLSAVDLEAQLARHEDIAFVIPVHMYGLPCRSKEINEIVAADEKRRGRRLSVVYDAAHAFGAARDGQRVGAAGSAEVFSLSVTKVLVTVEGGMVSSRDGALIDRIRKMRNYGVEANYDAHYPGLNGKMSELHAIVGLANLGRIDSLMAERQRKARYFLNRIESSTHFLTFPWPEDVVHTFKDFTVLVPRSLADRRAAVMGFLKERGIETRAYFYPPVHEQQYFKRFADRPLPVTESLARRVITLPFYSTIAEADLDYIASALAEAERKLV
jgi:dTDP-4-amino-4,6-dideoxygalactose transaminase